MRLPIHKNIPAKDHLKKLEIILEEIRNDYFTNVNEGNRLRSQIVTIEHITKENCNELVKSLINDLHIIRTQIIEIRDNDRSDNEYLKQQTQYLIAEKIKIQNELSLLNTKLNQLEVDVGIGYSNII